MKFVAEEKNGSSTVILPVIPNFSVERVGIVKYYLLVASASVLNFWLICDIYVADSC